jgi:superfamily II DNA or RNA helicase
LAAAGKWCFSPEHGEPCRVIDTETIWGETVCRVWLPARESVVRLPAGRLRPLEDAGAHTVEGIIYLAAAARVADALTRDVLLAPIESAVIPLPHQIRALSKAISGDRVRYLLADEVGLGKTIEAGLIMRELKLRGLVTRTLVITPKGLVAQWVAEMQTHFGEEFRLLIPGDFSVYRRIAKEDNLWRSHPQVVCPMDSVKPLDGRRGWSLEQVAEYNRERFADLVCAGWDLIIVDEAHRLGGSTDQVARYKLGQGLAEAAPYLLLLSATPHQGKTDQFRRVMSLLDPTAFPDEQSISRERVEPYVIRTQKRRAIDADGRPLFKPRRTELMPVMWEDCHREQRLLYEAATEYVREGYNQALAEKRSYVGFLLLLMQRLVVSSTRAILTALERRLEALQAPEEQLALFPVGPEEDWLDLDGQEQMDMLLGARLRALKNERAEVELLLEAARRCEGRGPDAKAEALLGWIYRLQAEEGDPNLKVLVFTEFVPTQEMLRDFLTERGFKVVCLNGSMNIEERKRVEEAFANDARILVSTDAGGEGLNLQFCHVVINYDIPWNPMRLEQRIGRVDRIGQTHTVYAINFVLKDSVEHRVREVLEEKLAVIFEEFGIDKTGDVLDSAQAGQIFDDLYVEAILNPDAVETKADEALRSLQEQAEAVCESASVLGSTEDLDPREAQQLLAHPLPHWVERMTVSYLAAHGGKAEKRDGVWYLTWPGGERLTDVVFHGKEAGERPASHLLTLEDAKVRGLATRLPVFVPSQPVPVITLPDLPPGVTGLWSLWRISISAAEWNRRRIIPLFLADDGRVLLPTAHRIWDQLLTTSPTIRDYLGAEASSQAFERLRRVAERQGKEIYDELLQAHRERLAQEREKSEYAFASRRRAIERIGLAQVRGHRLVLLEQEERKFTEELERRAQILPGMEPLLIVWVQTS